LYDESFCRSYASIWEGRSVSAAKSLENQLMQNQRLNSRCSSNSEFMKKKNFNALVKGTGKAALEQVKTFSINIIGRTK
jgi:hypothetical protein